MLSNVIVSFAAFFCGLLFVFGGLLFGFSLEVALNRAWPLFFPKTWWSLIKQSRLFSKSPPLTVTFYGVVGVLGDEQVMVLSDGTKLLRYFCEPWRALKPGGATSQDLAAIRSFLLKREKEETERKLQAEIDGFPSALLTAKVLYKVGEGEKE